jgi:hypothetical protein
MRPAPSHVKRRLAPRAGRIPTGNCRRAHAAAAPKTRTLPSLPTLSTTSMSGAADCSAVASARRRSFLFIFTLQSLGLGPKVTPPPGKSGDVLLPRRALPVPFCL